MNQYAQRISRNAPFIDEQLQAAVRQARVGFLGCGLASQIALSAARLGFEHFSLWDGDSVDVSNLNRQAFRNDQVGINKAEATRALLLEVNPEAQVFVQAKHCTAVTVPQMLDGVDILINSSDFDDVVYEATDQASERGIYSLQPLNLGFGGCCIVFGPGSISLEEMTGGRKRNDAEFILALAHSAQGLKLSDEFGAAIPALLARSAEQGYFPQNAIATGFTTSLVVHALLRIVAKKTEDLMAPRVLNFDPLAL